MSVFKKDEKKTFAFPNGVAVNEVNSAEEFISSGAGAEPKKKRNLSGAKLGRPKKADNEKKLNLVHMYITNDEKKELEKLAKDMHMSISSYLKFKVFQKTN